jgi:uncharacterized membrane-anchored protein
MIVYTGIGYGGSAAIFSAMILTNTVAYYPTTLSRTAIFWAAFILTRPLGAVVGDFLDKPLASGDLALDRYAASLVMLSLIVTCIYLFPQKAATKVH